MNDAWHRKMVLNGDRIKSKLFIILEHLLKCPWIVNQPLRVQELGQSGIGWNRHHTNFVFVVCSRGRCRHCRHIFSSIGIPTLFSLLSTYMLYTKYEAPAMLISPNYKYFSRAHDSVSSLRSVRSWPTHNKKNSTPRFPFSFFSYREWKLRRRSACKIRRLER